MRPGCRVSSSDGHDPGSDQERRIEATPEEDASLRRTLLELMQEMSLAFYAQVDQPAAQET